MSGTIFDGNVAVTGHGGAIASVDSSLSVFNSSMLDTFGGAVYFGTSADDGRDQLEVRERGLKKSRTSQLSAKLVARLIVFFLYEVTSEKKKSVDFPGGSVGYRRSVVRSWCVVGSSRRTEPDGLGVG